MGGTASRRVERDCTFGFPRPCCADRVGKSRGRRDNALAFKK